MAKVMMQITRLERPELNEDDLGRLARMMRQNGYYLVRIHERHIIEVRAVEPPADEPPADAEPEEKASG